MATELTFPGDLTGLRLAQDLIEEALRTAAFAEHAIFAVKPAVEEALVDAIRYGNEMDPDKGLHIAFSATEGRFDFRVTAEASVRTFSVTWPPTH